jgi:hypothetical protein
LRDTVRIKHSYFDYGGEIDVCPIYRINNKPARLSIRRKGDLYELYACPYYPSPFQEEVLAHNTLEEVIQFSNTLVKGFMGPDWMPDEFEPEDI